MSTIAIVGDITKLPVLHRVIALDIRPHKRREKPAVEEKDGKFTAMRGGLTASGATRDEAIAALKLLEKQSIAERQAKGESVDDDEMDEEDEEDEEDDRADSDRFDISFSSDVPCARWFGDEILDHSPNSIDMSRCTRGMAFLVDHNTGDQVGLIERFKSNGKKTGGVVRFSRSAHAQDIKRDIQDGIRPFTSIGYRVLEMRLEKEEDAGNGSKKRTYRVTKWMPMEGSTVAVPADVSVGPGRAAGAEEFPVTVLPATSGSPTTPVVGAEVRSAAAQTPQIQITEKKQMNPKEVAEVYELCSRHGIDQKRAAELVQREGMTADLASREILKMIGERDGRQVQTPAAESQAMLTLSEREQKQYNICRGIMTHVRNAEESKRENCFELEVSQEVAKTVLRNEGAKDHGGIFVPYNLGIDPSLARNAAEFLKRAGVATALTVGTTGQGKELVFTEPGPFISFLYNQMRLKELGAETISGLVGNVAFPKQTGKANGSWVGENPGTDVADSNLTLVQVTTSPKTYQSSTSYSRQLLAQAVIDIDNLVRSDLARDCALAIDLAGISGAGSGSNQPLGILGTTGVQAYTLEGDTGNGAKPNWDDVTIMQELLEDVNADQVGEFRWLTTPGIKGLWKRTPRLVYTPGGTTTTVNVTGDPIWADGNEVDGLMARWSNQVPKNLTKGTSNACHALILGVFSALINGLWGSGFELVVDPYRLKKQGLIELTTFILTDWANRYPVAFVAAQDCLKS